MPTEAGDWTMITDKISRQWRHLMDVHSDTTHLGQWIGLYIDRGEDLALALQCVTEFSPPCMQLHHLSMPLPVQCFTVGTHYQCLLREKENLIKDMIGFLHEMKCIHTTKGLKKEGERKKSFSSMVKRPLLAET